MDIIITGKHADIDGLLPGMTVTVTIDEAAGGRCPVSVTIAKPGQSVERAIGDISATALDAVANP